MSINLTSIVLTEELFKTVYIYGMNEIKLPTDINYIAIDEDGSMYGYEDKPRRTYNGWDKSHSSWERGSTMFEIAKVTFTGDWEESLIEE